MAPEIELTITRGKTFEFAFLFADDERVYRPITAMPQSAPVRLTIPGHGMPDGWPFRIECVKTPSELNSVSSAVYFAKVIDDDTVELNGLNAHCWKAFSGTGIAVYQKPMNLAGWTCRAQVRNCVGGELLFAWEPSPAAGNGAASVDVAGSSFVLSIDAALAASLAWSYGVYDLEATDGNGKVYPVTAISPVQVLDEVTV